MCEWATVLVRFLCVLESLTMLRNFRVYLLTWNVVGRPPIEDLRPALGLLDPVDPLKLPDLYAIGLQEVSAKPQDRLLDILFDDPWINAAKQVLSRWDYVKLKQVRLQGIILVIFCKRTHLIHIRGIQTRYTRTGLGGIWGNKGGVSVRFNAYGCSLCIVNSHLAAHDEDLDQRIYEYNNIVDTQNFVDSQSKNILTHDYVFWMGDLNFRINDFSNEEVKLLIEKENYTHLLAKDQLRQVMKTGEAFSEFTEKSPTFAPTYRFVIDSENYDYLNRKPAWTDRILYRFTQNAYEQVLLDLKQHHYKAHPLYLQSDHKPVSSMFSVKVFAEPREDLVTFLPLRNWKTNSDGTTYYRTAAGTKLKSWDWIGLYREKFGSIDEYLCYVWASTRPQETQQSIDNVFPASVSQVGQEQGNKARSDWLQYRVTFADQTLLVPGVYQLIYISSSFDDVLGMSDLFEIQRG